jgi:hypothetical protein
LHLTEEKEKDLIPYDDNINTASQIDLNDPIHEE